jgi:hypothetical protein
MFKVIERSQDVLPGPRPVGCKVSFLRLLPPRSMVGQLPLEQHIGVRIPGGQPNRINNLYSTPRVLCGSFESTGIFISSKLGELMSTVD